MRTLPTLACISAAALLAACAPYPNGYYDANGSWHYYGDANSNAPAIAGGPPTDYVRTTTPDYNQPYSNSYTATTPNSSTTTTTTYSYNRAGYYDRNGYYIAMDAGPQLPQGYFPPRGMCRVWFTDRPVNYQPAVESCSGIQSRVPTGAYVLYGG